jgi:ABC-type multidrug transport system fused ATPase/permease subunit
MLALVTLGKIAVGFCDLSVAAAMYLLFLLLQGHPPTHHLWWAPRTALSAAMITTLLVVLRGLMDLLSSRAVFRQIENLYSDFLLRLTDGYSKLQWEQFVERNRSELSGHALHTAREAADFYYLCIEMTANVVIVSVMTAALVYQSLIAACTLALVLALFYGGHRLLIRERLQKAASIRETALRMLQRNLADLFSSGKEIRTYGNQAFFQERIRRQAERVAVSKLRTQFLPHFARIAADQGAVLVFLAFVIAVELRQGDVRQVLSLLVFYFVLSRRLLPLISQISFVAGQMEGSYENVKVVDSELNRCRQYRMLALPARMPDAGMVMQMMQVSFSFHGGPPILRNMDLAIREGETVVLHGASGIGKSSLLNLVAGVSQPVTGVVRVDRTRIAYVPQEIPLLDDSIRNNLLFGLPHRSDEELMKVLAVAKLDGFVTALPLWLETGVGDNGALFSGGERQRLGLARAILRGSPLLLLDEATSALDEENERQILDNLNASGMAILLVTHRAHTRSFAHRVLRLEEGSLIEETSQALLV